VHGELDQAVWVGREEVEAGVEIEDLLVSCMSRKGMIGARGKRFDGRSESE
jgi:hypothetical protein